MGARVEKSLPCPCQHGAIHRPEGDSVRDDKGVIGGRIFLGRGGGSLRRRTTMVKCWSAMKTFPCNWGYSSAVLLAKFSCFLNLFAYYTEKD